MTHHDELLAATAPERAALLATPFIRDGAAGALTREDYLDFLGQAYHHVKHTLPLVMACGSRLPARLEWLRTAMAHYVEEETGHQEWILNDIRACGGDAKAVRNASPRLPAEVLVAYAYDVIHRVNPVGFLGMVLVLEGTSAAVATRAADALMRALDLPRTGFSYLTSHGTLDIEHTRFFETLVNGLDEKSDLAVLAHCARVFYRLYADIFSDLDAVRMRRAALEAA